MNTHKKYGLFIILTLCVSSVYAGQNKNDCSATWSLQIKNIIDNIAVGEYTLDDLYNNIVSKGKLTFNITDKNPILRGINTQYIGAWNSLFNCINAKITSLVKSKLLPSTYQTYVYDLSEVNESLRRIIDELSEQYKITQGKIKEATKVSAQKRLEKYQGKLITIEQNTQAALFDLKNFKGAKNNAGENIGEKGLEEIFPSYQKFFEQYAKIKSQYEGILSGDQIVYFFQTLGIFRGSNNSEIEKKRSEFVQKLAAFKQGVSFEIPKQEALYNKISSFNFFEKKRAREKLNWLKELYIYVSEMLNALLIKYENLSYLKNTNSVTTLVSLKAEIDVLKMIAQSVQFYSK